MVRKTYSEPAIIYETYLEVRAGTPAKSDSDNDDDDDIDYDAPSKTVPDRRPPDDKDDYYAKQWDAQDARAYEASQRDANQDAERNWWSG